MTTLKPSSEDIKEMLENSDSGIDLSFGVNLFIGIQPSDPSNAVTLIDSGGIGMQKHGMEIPNLQILVRDKVYITGWDLANSIKYFLNEKHNEVWNGTRYMSIMQRSEIGFMGADPKNRFEWSMNFQIYRTA